jgi:hypothetical protein
MSLEKRACPTGLQPFDVYLYGAQFLFVLLCAFLVFLHVGYIFQSLCICGAVVAGPP